MEYFILKYRLFSKHEIYVSRLGGTPYHSSSRAAEAKVQERQI